MIKKTFLGCILLLFFICPLRGDDCYSEYWQKFYWQMWENDSFGLGTYVKLETGNHLKAIRYMQFKEQFQWNASHDLSLEIHYAYLHRRAIVPHSLWRWQHRLELEANYLFDLPCNCFVETRNRLEISREQNEPKTIYRLRQRTMLILPFESMGALKSYSVYNELFYNVSTRLFTQNRLCPCQLTFALSNKIDLDVFFLVRFFRTDDIWHKSAVVGTQLSF